MTVINIAIDGPAGAGKSTVAKKLASRLGYTYIDTGAMYRAIGWFTYAKIGENIFDENCFLDFVEKHLEKISLHLEDTAEGQKVYVNEEEVSALIRTRKMGAIASIVSANKDVRSFLTKQQKAMAKKTSVVMDGRDIGTQVLPNADVKIYLTASTQVRAKRRYEELMQKGEASDLASLEEEIKERDHRDMTRQYAPLKKADDAIEIDSSNMDIDQVVNEIYKQIEKVVM